MACHALRHPAHADDRSQPADRRAHHAVRVAAAVERGIVGRLCGSGPGYCGRRQGPDEDSIEICDQGDIGRRSRSALPLGRLVHRFEKRHEGSRLFRRRPSAGGRRIPRRALADGHPARFRAGLRNAILAPHAWQSQGLQILPRTFCQDAQHQSARRRPHLSVRLARRVVRRRSTGFSLRTWLALHGGRRLSGELDDRVWPCPGACAVCDSTQPRRSLP